MAELISVARLFADGYHNAFTDLLFWQGHYYLGFRVGQSHGISPAGDVVIYRSDDLSAWTLCVRFDTGGDDRDPKLIDAGDRLGVVFGTWFSRWGNGTKSVANAEHDLVSHVALSRDGLCWSTPRQVYGVNYWLWRILPCADGFYCPAYHFARRDDRDMRTVHLLYSDDLLSWNLIGLMRSGGGPGEPVLFRTGEQQLSCVVRTLEPNHHSWIGYSQAPYTEWKWSDLGAMIHAPVVLNVQGQWIVAGRSQECDLPSGSFERFEGTESTHHTSVWAIVDDCAELLMTMPSACDCSYPGLALGADGEVLMSYYSQHAQFPLPAERPTPADIFLARFKL
ncbi:MAG: hypothetical protein QGG64_11525 [Candidatus Latescibacteria bacterium]|nr:hypothetical protein [Candidatus Latescibacterota bacterium]